jgi:hypothetical protein
LYSTACNHVVIVTSIAAWKRSNQVLTGPWMGPHQHLVASLQVPSFEVQSSVSQSSPIAASQRRGSSEGLGSAESLLINAVQYPMPTHAVQQSGGEPFVLRRVANDDCVQARRVEPGSRGCGPRPSPTKSVVILAEPTKSSERPS